MTTSMGSLPAAKRARTGERTMLACIGCKQKKLKCDGQIPKCQNCTKSDRDCLVEDPATGLHRPRDHLKSLESRVAYLESLLQQVRPEVALDHMPPVVGDESYTTQPGPAPLSPTDRLNDSSCVGPGRHELATGLAQASDRTRRASSVQPEDQQVDVLSSEVALLCLSATGRDPHYFGPSSAVSFSRIVSATMGLRSSHGVGSGSQHSFTSGRESSSLPSARDQPALRLPSSTAAAKLAKAYFDNIHPQYPILHRPTFDYWEQELYNGPQSGSLKDVANVPRLFVLMVYAIGSLVTGQQNHDTAEEYYAAALDYISPVLELNNLQSIQAILCCAIYSIRSPVGVNLWKISGMAIRHCVELGYHRSTVCYRRNVDILTKEMLKRCFWVAHDIDRVAAFTLGRPVGIPEDCIDVELPADIDDENITAAGLLCSPRSSTTEPPTVMTGALHVIKLRRLWAKFNNCLYSKTSALTDDAMARQAVAESLRGELEEWRASLPSQLDFAHSNPLSVFASSSWFTLAYDHSVLLLYRPFIAATIQPRDETGSTDHIPTDLHEDNMVGRAECALCAREMCLLYRRLYQSSSIQFTWGSLHILFLGGLTYLYCLWRSRRVREMTKQTDVVSTCLACSTVLVIIAERWNLATSYRDLFEALSEKTISMICGERNLSNPPQDAWAGPEGPVEDPILQDWINGGLNDMTMPQESEWLVQELLQGVPNEFCSTEDALDVDWV